MVMQYVYVCYKIDLFVPLQKSLHTHPLFMVLKKSKIPFCSLNTYIRTFNILHDLLERPLSPKVSFI